MGMVASFIRITSGELDRAPTGYYELWTYVQEIGRTSQEVPAGERDVYVDKAWHGLAYLLDQADSPLDLLYGGEILGEPGGGGFPIRCFDRDDVAEAAEFFAATPYAKVEQHFDPQAMEDDDIYPNIWVDEADDVSETWLKPAYEELAALFTAAAKAGDCVLMTIG